MLSLSTLAMLLSYTRLSEENILFVIMQFQRKKNFLILISLEACG